MAKVRTMMGHLVDPFDLQLEDIRPAVFIHSLSQINRFTGHAKHPYSVALHSLNLYKAVPLEPEIERAALVHDWAEAFFNDVSSPVKRECPDYRAAERAAAKRITDYLGISVWALQYLDDYDKRIYKDERNALFDTILDVGMGDQYEPLGVPPESFLEYDWRQVRYEYTHTFLELFPEWHGKSLYHHHTDNSGAL